MKWRAWERKGEGSKVPRRIPSPGLWLLDLLLDSEINILLALERARTEQSPLSAALDPN